MNHLLYDMRLYIYINNVGISTNLKLQSIQRILIIYYETYKFHLSCITV